MNSERSSRSPVNLAWLRFTPFVCLLAICIAAALFVSTSHGSETPQDPRIGLTDAIAVSPAPQEETPQGEKESSVAVPIWLLDTIGDPAGLPTRREEGDPQESDSRVPADGEDLDAFSDLSSMQAVALIRDKFPDLVDMTLDPAPPLEEGERITGYPTPFVATLQTAAGGTAVAESLLPLITVGAEGEVAPIDLQLQDGSQGFEPRNTAVPVVIGKELSEGLRLPTLELTLKPVDASNEPLQGPASIEGAVALFTNTQPDTDTLVKPTPAGLQTHSILRSPTSPESLRFRVEVADKEATLTQLDSGGILVEADARQITTIPPSLARDAAGEEVPVEMSIDGNTINLSVSHRNQGFRYPIDVDPTAADWNAFSSTAGNWVYTTNVPGQILGTLDTTWSDALQIENHFNHPYPSNHLNYGDYGAWFYQTQGVSRIYQLDAGIGGRNTTGTFIAISGAAGNEAIQWLAPYFGSGETNHTVCAKSGCSTTGGSSSNAAVYELIATESGTSYIHSEMMGATVRVVQDQPPSITFNTTDPLVGGKPNALYQGGSWINSSQGPSIGVSAADPGLGISSASITSPGQSTWSGNYNQALPGCVGIQCDPTWTVNRALGNIAEGERPIKVRVSNAAISGEVTKQVKIDNSGPMADFIGLGGSGIVGVGPSEVTLEITDGNAPTKSSGVAAGQTSVSLDGKTILSPGGQGCSPGPCTVEREFSFVGRDIGVGDHMLVATAVDQIGNKKTTEFPFVVTGKSGPTVDMGPGELDIRTGDFLLTQQDVAESAAGATLSLTRVHESLRKAGEPGPLGPGWQLSFGAWRGLRKLTDGTAVLSDTKGRQVFFDEIGNGYFYPSTEYPDWSLRYFAETQTYKLTSPSQGSTSFRRPSGAPPSLYAPSFITRPDGTQSMFFDFEYVSGTLRPRYASASPPEAVEMWERGARFLGFSYDSSTTASGTAPGNWGNFKGRLSTVTLTAWNPESKGMVSLAVAEYAYDGTGRLRAVWDPRISPGLKTTYGYDAAGRVTAVTPPAQQPWVLKYGSVPDSAHDDWLLAASRTDASEEFGNGQAPTNTALPVLSNTYPIAGRTHNVWNGGWTSDPLAFTYQWSRCNSAGKECLAIPGATDQKYKPTVHDLGYRLVATVTATNAGGSTAASSLPSVAVMRADLQVAYEQSFGSQGTGNGQFEIATDAAIDPTDGTIWVTDDGNDRIQHFSAAGAFLGKFASCEDPGAVEVDSKGQVYVACSSAQKIQKFDATGKLLKQIAGYGTGNGQVRFPLDLALDSEENLWVADTENDRVQKFDSAGQFVKAIPLGPSGRPWGLDVASNGKVWVAEKLNQRVSVFDPQGQLLFRFGSPGSAAGQFERPVDVEVDDDGYAWVADAVNNRVQVFNEAGEYISQFGQKGTGQGQFNTDWWLRIATNGKGDIFVVDQGNFRVQRWSRSEMSEGETPPPPDPTTAVWTAIYDVPLFGADVPNMNAGSVARWGQSTTPVEAAAIFPPDQVPSRQPGDYKRATIFYMDAQGQIINTRSPGDRISTQEHDQYGNLIRTLTPENRARSMATGAASKVTAEQLDSRLTYSEDGARLVSVLGPKRKVKLENGNEVEARLSTKYFYDEGAPEEGGPYELITKQTEGALVGGVEHDVKTKTFDYSGQSGLGWKLGKPTSETDDPAGLSLTTVTLYDENTGDVTETRMPSNPQGGDASATEVIRYSAGASKVPVCANHPEWAGLTCQIRPVAQPGTPGLPNLPVSTTTYNVYNQPLVTTEVVGAETRVAMIDYDAAGRPVGATISSTIGKPLPEVHTVYDEETGLPTVINTETQLIISEYDSLGRRISYTDADGNLSTYEYDTLGRVTEVFDGKGSQSFGYDATTGDLNEIQDSAIGAMTAEYDSGGKMTSMSFPNGLKVKYGYDGGGFATALEYVKTKGCTEKCLWFKESQSPSIHGKILSQDSSLAQTSYTYDRAGRLTHVQETPQGKGCSTRLYTYDSNTNRTSTTLRGPAAGGACAQAGGETQTTAFDKADRLLGTGISYDAFGNITALPGVYAGAGGALSSSYYADDSAASLTQGGKTTEYLLDPAGRERETVFTEGVNESTVISHFSGDSDSPAWTEDDGGNWTRYIASLGGMTAIQSSTAGIDLQLADLQGNIVATVPYGSVSEQLEFSQGATEYGVPKGGGSAKYSWLGADQRSTELDSGVVNMGARTYVPTIGRFLQTDPVPGGSANAYAYVFGDPVTETDLSGEYTPGSAPTWLTEFMENPPGMPPPPAEPEAEVEVEEEESWDDEAEFLLLPVSVVPVGANGNAVAEATVAVFLKIVHVVVREAAKIAAMFGRTAARTFKTAVRFAINAAKGGARTVESVAVWVKREFDTRIPELIQCGHAAYETIMKYSSADWKARASAGAAGCIDAIRRYRRS